MRFLPALFSFLFFIFPATPGKALDVIHLNDGRAVQCKIEGLTDNIVTFIIQTRLPNGQPGTSKHSIKTDLVKFIDFGPVPGEEELLPKLDTASVEEIDPVWDKLYRNLHRPKSNTGKIGVALGYALLKKDNDYHWKRALELFDQIHETAWDLETRNAGRQGRLQTLIRMGKLDQAITEARALAAETEDATMLIEARYIVAQADFEKLKAIEDEHPKWEEDDEVRPERNRIYHNTIDQFLWPYLFHGTREESAARGLLAAGEVYQFANEADLATACYEDVVKLYPETGAAEKAREFLSKTNQTNPSPNESNENQ